MFGNSMIVRRATAALSACALVVAFWLGPETPAQTPKLYLDVDDVSGFIGQLVTIPVHVQTTNDSLDGYQISIALSRDDLIYFEVDTVVTGNDTSYQCEVDTVGALTSGWEHVEARSTGGVGLDLRLSGISAVAPGSVVKGIPDYTSGVLVRIFARIKTDVPDTLTDRLAVIDVHDGSTWYSNQNGLLIQPAENLDGSVTVEQGIKGDVNCDGVRNPIDVVLEVNYVYKGWLVLCQVSLGDLDCNGSVNPVDVVRLVNYVYKGWAIPPCP